MDLPLIDIIGIALAFLAVVVALLNWLYPRVASARRPDPPEDPERDEGLALVLGAMLLMALNRRKARAEKR